MIIEEMISNAVTMAVGNPLYIGLLILGFFFAITAVTRMQGPTKYMVLVPAAILTLAFMPQLAIFLILGCAIIVYLAFIRLWSKQ